MFCYNSLLLNDTLFVIVPYVLRLWNITFDNYITVKVMEHSL